MNTIIPIDGPLLLGKQEGGAWNIATGLHEDDGHEDDGRRARRESIKTRIAPFADSASFTSAMAAAKMEVVMHDRCGD